MNWWGGGMWAPDTGAAERKQAPIDTAPARQRVRPSLIIRLAWPIVIGLAAYEWVPFWTVVIAWPLIEILRRVDVIAKAHFRIDVDDEE
jgi:hypothetical protein